MSGCFRNCFVKNGDRHLVTSELVLYALEKAARRLVFLGRTEWRELFYVANNYHALHCRKLLDQSCLPLLLCPRFVHNYNCDSPQKLISHTFSSYKLLHFGQRTEEDTDIAENLNQCRVFRNTEFLLEQLLDLLDICVLPRGQARNSTPAVV